MSDTNTNGGPAVEVPLANGGAAIDLRDYFAAKAIEGAASGDGGLPDSSYCQLIAKRAYEIADAMLKARGQQ